MNRALLLLLLETIAFFIIFKYLFAFAYSLFGIVTFIVNLVHYFIGLIFTSVIVLLCYLIYIIPLLISSSCQKCEYCRNKNESESNRSKLSYSYFCTKNKKPLITTLIIYIAILLALLSVGIYYLFKKFRKNKNNSIIAITDEDMIEENKCLEYNDFLGECEKCSPGAYLYKGNCIIFSVKATYSHISYNSRPVTIFNSNILNSLLVYKINIEY